MSMRTVDHLLVGGGISAATCAAELRGLGADGPILVVGDEAHAPYHRPPLTKGYLEGREPGPDLLLYGPTWWQRNDVELLTGTTVMSIDPGTSVAALSSGEEVRFRQMLLATGAHARRLPAELDGDLTGVHYIRTLADADRLRCDLVDAERVVLVGGSYVACEAAASLASTGKTCTMLMPETQPFRRSFGATAGDFFRSVLESHGVRIVGGDGVARYESASGRVLAVRTEQGRSLKADVVVVGVGAVPNVELARSAGLRIGDAGGVHCDALLRSRHSAIFCAGDMCEYASVVHGRRLRLEHENVAVEQARTVASNMLGYSVAHAAVPYLSSDLSDWASLEYIGPAAAWDEEIVRGSMDDGAFSTWYIRGNRVVGALMVGRSSELDHACELLASRADISNVRHLLANPDSDLSYVTLPIGLVDQPWTERSDAGPKTAQRPWPYGA